MLVPVVVDCLNLTSPSNGEVSLNTTTFESVATYTCEEGYLLGGFPVRECQANGSWSEEEPFCVRKLLKMECFNGLAGYVYVLQKFWPWLCNRYV